MSDKVRKFVLNPVGR